MNIWLYLMELFENVSALFLRHSIFYRFLFFQCFSAECHELMLQLKVTVDGLLALPSVNVWNIPGGLERLDRCIRHILKHGLKTSYVCNYVNYLGVIVIYVNQMTKAGC